MQKDTLSVWIIYSEEGKPRALGFDEHSAWVHLFDGCGHTYPVVDAIAAYKALGYRAISIVVAAPKLPKARIQVPKLVDAARCIIKLTEKSPDVEELNKAISCLKQALERGPDEDAADYLEDLTVWDLLRCSNCLFSCKADQVCQDFAWEDEKTKQSYFKLLAKQQELFEELEKEKVECKQ